MFLRGYALNAAGDPVSTGKLIEGGNGGMATWADVKAQAADLLGIQLIDSDVGNIPLLATDQYGNFIPGPNGYPQMVIPGALRALSSSSKAIRLPMAGWVFSPPAPSAPDTPSSPISPTAPCRRALPTATSKSVSAIPTMRRRTGNTTTNCSTRTYIAGDGRANENIGLTAVHHVFHSEHNRLVEHTKDVILADAPSHARRRRLAGRGRCIPQRMARQRRRQRFRDAAEMAALVWDGERLFQAAKFGTEMQYQHLVFEEFARKIQPNINVFLVPDGYDVTINPDIVAEFAHVVYRFGHSMLTETIDRFDPTFTDHDIGLIEGFLNPLQFETNGTGAVVDADISRGCDHPRHDPSGGQPDRRVRHECAPQQSAWPAARSGDHQPCPRP